MTQHSPEKLSTVFTQNRTEEIGLDVWQHFVVPPFFDRLDLETARKPRVIIGGRGCGKTMLIRYLSYHSTFSPKRPSVPREATRHIGLYWRADTQFALLMTGRNLSPEIWASAFSHFVALTVAADVLDSIIAIWASGALASEPHDIDDVSLSGMTTFDPDFGGGINAVRQAIERHIRRFEVWTSNVGKVQEPIFMPGTHFVSALIAECKLQNAIPDDAIFFVYVDEYENLLEYQKRIINTCLKHSEQPLIFNIAMKRHGFSTRQTVGDESIVDIADFRTHDIEGYLDQGFDLFAAEVLMLTLRIAGWNVPIEEAHLRDPAQLASRREPGYREEVLGVVRRMFPGLSHEELARRVFEDNTMRGRLLRIIERALKARNSDIPASEFLRPLFPQASVVASALLHRNALKPAEVLEEMNKLSVGEPNRFTGNTDWTQNNFVGCLLALYEPSARVCPIYAGFDTFTLLAKVNLRHFLELCHQSLADYTSPTDINAVSVDVDRQAQAARHTSNAFLGQIRSFGRLGNRLHSFVLRLGSLFALAHQRPTQSEPEQAHFSVTRGNKPFTNDDQKFLDEAVMWSVLFEAEETKVKDQPAGSYVEYVLNPIYAPYFKITFRKRRKLELNIEEFRVLESGSYDDFNRLLKQYSRMWTVNPGDADPSLFSHLSED